LPDLAALESMLHARAMKPIDPTYQLVEQAVMSAVIDLGAPTERWDERIRFDREILVGLRRHTSSAEGLNRIVAACFLLLRRLLLAGE
jgi:hypothetical protein